MADTGRDDGGVLGPVDEAAEVKEDCVSALELWDDPMELTRGDAVPDEYACGGGGRGSEGNLSFTYSGRCCRAMGL